MAQRDYEQELANIYEGLAESVLEASDEEIEEEIRDEGLDPEVEAEKVRQILRGAVERHRTTPSLLSEAYVPGPLDFTKPLRPRKPKDGGTN